jgi:PDDEXK-like domain of unknown function (DUF3799)
MAEGIIRGMPMEKYQSIKALSASGIWALADEAPAKYWIRSPFNPGSEPENSATFDIGIAAHLAVLESSELEARTRIVRGHTKTGKPSSGYGTEDAKEQRDAAYAAGVTPLLPEQMDTVLAIARSIEAHPIAREAFRGGTPEVTFTWSDELTGTPCKCRVDYLPGDGSYLVDLKSAANANPREWIKVAARLGYFARAAFYLDGVAQITGSMPKDYWFVNVEREPPHLISVCAFEIKALEFGRMINRRGLDLFKYCMRTQDWHGYREPGATRDRAFRVELPAWATYALADRDAAGEFRQRISADDSRRSQEWLEP